MKVIRGLRHIAEEIGPAVLTIGVFDGVHLGHRRIIGDVVRRARRLGLNSVVVTFDPHPLKILHASSNVPSLISLNHRIRLIEDIGADFLIIVNFTKSLANMSPKEFVNSLVVSRIDVKEIYVGENFYFGKGAKAGVETLREIGKSFGFNVRVVRPIEIAGDMISSSAIRRLIMDGRIEKAAKFLGRPVSVLGTVVGGSRLARALGYPTANINPHHEVIPPSGVYAVSVRYRGRPFKGVLNIGSRPTFYSPRDREPTIEAHIFDFNERIYGKDLEILFIKKLRDEQRFASRDELVAQIRKDETAARTILKSRA